MNFGEEIISLQFGNFANYIGSHYFNVQEAGFSFNPNFVPDIVPDRLFRCSKDGSGNILNYTPRVVLVEDELYSTIKDEGKITELTTPSVSVPDHSQSAESSSASYSKAQKTDTPLLKSIKSSENINNWMDFSNVSYHPRSITYSPREYGLSCPETFFNTGSSVTKKTSFWERFEDNVRYFAEECDMLQGFQILSEGHTAYSGLASNALSYLNDEFSKKVRILTAAYFIPETTSYYEKQIYSCNALSLLAEAHDNSDLIIPISIHRDPWILEQPSTCLNLRNVNYRCFDRYENSAVLAAAYEYITLPYRKRDETNISMTQLCHLNILGRSISNPGILMPFPAMKTDSLANILRDWNGSFFECISPFGSFNCDGLVDIMYIISKGVSKKTRFDSTKNLMVVESNEELEQNMMTFIQALYAAKIIRSFSSSTNFRIPSTYPDIFNNSFNLTHLSSLETLGRISEFNGMSCLINSQETKNMLEKFSSRALKSFRKFHLTSEEASDIDFKSISERIMSLAWNYSDSYDF